MVIDNRPDNVMLTVWDVIHIDRLFAGLVKNTNLTRNTVDRNNILHNTSKELADNKFKFLI